MHLDHAPGRADRRRGRDGGVVPARARVEAVVGVRLGERQVQREPLERDPAVGDRGHGGVVVKDADELVRGEAEAAHRRQRLEQHAHRTGAVDQDVPRRARGDRADEPRGVRAVGELHPRTCSHDVGGLEGREDQHVAVVLLQGLGRLEHGADGEAGQPEALGLADEPAGAEAVAVALGHRHEVALSVVVGARADRGAHGVAGRGGVGAPPVAVDVQRERHAPNLRRERPSDGRGRRRRRGTSSGAAAGPTRRGTPGRSRRCRA